MSIDLEDEEDDLVVQVEESAADEQDVKVEERRPEPARASDAAAEDLRQQLEAMRRQKTEQEEARRAAEEDARRARQAAAEAASAAQQFRTEAQDHRLATITSALSAVSSALETARANYTAAMERGDWAATAQYQQDISENAARKVQLESGKSALEARLEQARAQQEEARRQPPPPPSDPVERFLSQRNLTQASADFLRRNPELVTDQTKYNRMMAAHHDALASGIQPDTTRYFDHLLEGTKQVERKTQDQPAVSAPPGRGASGSEPTPGQRSNVVRLTPAEVEAARISGLTPQEYARNKQALVRDGRIAG